MNLLIISKKILEVFHQPCFGRGRHVFLKER